MPPCQKLKPHPPVASTKNFLLTQHIQSEFWKQKALTGKEFVTFLESRWLQCLRAVWYWLGKRLFLGESYPKLRAFPPDFVTNLSTSVHPIHPSFSLPICWLFPMWEVAPKIQKPDSEVHRLPRPAPIRINVTFRPSRAAVMATRQTPDRPPPRLTKSTATFSNFKFLFPNGKPSFFINK